MATELAKAYVGIIPSAEGITGNLAKVLEPEAESAGEKSGASLGGLLVSTLKGVLATAALDKALTDTLTEGGALEQSLGGVETCSRVTPIPSRLMRRMHGRRRGFRPMPTWKL